MAATTPLSGQSSAVASQSRNKLKPNSYFQPLKLQSAQSPWLGINLCLRCSYPKTDFQNGGVVTCTVVFSFPTWNPERIASTEKPPNVAGTSLAAKFLLANGITLFKVHEECVKLVGQGGRSLFSPMYPSLTEDAQRVLDWAVD